MAQHHSTPTVGRIAIIGLLAWLVPGLGHIANGERKRGLIILVTIACSFWGGIAIGGVRHTVDPQQKKLWFLAQICTGGHTLAAYGCGQRARAGLRPAELATSRWDSVDIGVVYTGVAGLLSILAILDALVRVDPAMRRDVPTRRPQPRGGGT